MFLGKRDWARSHNHVGIVHGLVELCSGPNRNSEPSRNQKDLKRRLDHLRTF